MPIVAAGAIMGAASLGGAALASSGANKAASTEANAALQAAQLQAGTSQQALNFQKQQYATSQQEMAPWLQSGQSALANLNYLLGIGPNQAIPPGVGPAGQPTAGQPTPGQPIAGQPARPVAPVQRGVGDQLTSTGMRPTLPGGIQQPVQFQPLSRLAQPAGTPAAGAPAARAAAPAGTMPAGYGGQTFQQLTGSGDPNVSPNQQTTAQWKAQGVPFQNITTADGRTVAVRTDLGGGPQASLAPPQGIQPSSASMVNPDLGAYGSLSKGWDQTFQAPTNVTEANDPGYQFRIQQAQQAMQKSAAAKGGLLSGGTARDLNDYIQNQASNEYGNVYNRAFNTYAQNYNTFSSDQTSKYNRLAALAGIGQQTASQLGTLGQYNADASGQILQRSGDAQASGINNAAAATASGYQNSGDIWGSTLSNLGNLAYLANLGQKQKVDLAGMGAGGQIPGLGGYNPYTGQSGSW